jgi:hypothetical protein
MKGSLQNEVAIEFVPWLERAKRKFAGATIHNSGQFSATLEVTKHLDKLLKD